MRIVFFGTPDYVVPVLESLHKNFKNKSEKSPIVCVVTQKPLPSGRKQILKYSLVDTWAHKKDIPKLYDPEEIITKNIQADLGVLAAYGSIVSQSVLDHFPLGILNIHPSLLPKFRGASPVQATLVTNNTPGATIIKLDSKLDHGPIVTSIKQEANYSHTTGALRSELFNKTVEALVEVIPPYTKGKINIKDQDHSKASFTTTITKKHAYIPLKFIKSAVESETYVKDWKIGFIKDYIQKPTPANIDRFIRAMDPWPIAWTTIKAKGQEKRLKIIKGHLKGEKLVLDKVQLEGKNIVSWEQFNQAYKIV